MSEVTDEKKTAKTTTKKKTVSATAATSGEPLFLPRGIMQANDIVARAWM